MSRLAQNMDRWEIQFNAVNVPQQSSEFAAATMSTFSGEREARVWFWEDWPHCPACTVTELAAARIKHAFVSSSMLPIDTSAGLACTCTGL